MWRQLKQFDYRLIDFELSTKRAQGEVRAVNINLGVVSTEMVVIRPRE